MTHDTRQHAVAADWVFDGDTLVRDAAVVVSGARIHALSRRDRLPRSMPVHEAPPGFWLSPGFVDLQVNGGGDVLFNDHTTADGIAAIVAAHRRFGTTALLPTLITTCDAKMRAALAAVDAAMARDPAVLGIHLEGPFISPRRPGVHDPRFIRAPTSEHAAMLGGPRRGVTLMTLAPECVEPAFIAQLRTAGIRVSLGHSTASYTQTRDALAEGLIGFTHLFNAMPQLASREPGPIAAALESPNAYYGLIVDGVHVHPATLRLALHGVGHPMLVTDAMPPVGGTATAFMLGDREIVVHEGRCTTADGTLAGSMLDMATAVRNCVTWLGVPLTRALQIASTTPAAFAGLGHELGRLAAGYRADIVAFDPRDMRVAATWVAGTMSRGT